MPKLSSRDTLIIAIVGILVVAGLVVAFIIMPRFGEISRLEGEITQADQQIAEARAVLARRQEAKAASARTQAQLLALANKMPDAPEMPSLIIELQDTANEAGLVFTTLKPSLPAADAGFSRMSITLEVSGQWPDMIEFFRRLGKLERQVRIVSAQISPVTSTDGATALKAQLAIEAYTLAATSNQPATPAAPTPAAQ